MAGKLRPHLGGSRAQLLSKEHQDITRQHIQALQAEIEARLAELELAETHLMLCEMTEQQMGKPSAEDYVRAVSQSGLIGKPSHWGAVYCFLCESGLPLSPSDFIAMVEHEAGGGLAPSRQLLYKSTPEHDRHERIPNWPERSSKERHLKAIMRFCCDVSMA